MLRKFFGAHKEDEKRINLSLYRRILCLIVLCSFGVNWCSFSNIATSGNNYGLVVLYTLGVMVFVLLSKALPNSDGGNDQKGPLASNLNETDECLLLQIPNPVSKMFLKKLMSGLTTTTMIWRQSSHPQK